MDHYRPNGELHHGYYCRRCGKPGLSMYHVAIEDHHGECEKRPNLVEALGQVNVKGTINTEVDDPYAMETT